MLSSLHPPKTKPYLSTPSTSTRRAHTHTIIAHTHTHTHLSLSLSLSLLSHISAPVEMERIDDDTPGALAYKKLHISRRGGR
jgi:hypothetical protein